MACQLLKTIFYHEFIQDFLGREEKKLQPKETSVSRRASAQIQLKPQAASMCCLDPEIICVSAKNSFFLNCLLGTKVF